MEKRVRNALKPNAQPFDEIRITTVPRYKSSGLSGSEWRISGKIELMRKGMVVHEEGMADVKNCAYALGLVLMRAMDDGKAYFGGGENGTCDQEGCSEKANVFYRVKKKYCDEAWSHEPIELSDEIVIRQFCERHSKRGDCGFDDADANYELLDGDPKPVQDNDVSESVFGGVISLGE